MRVTSKGQITIPVDVRKRLGIGPGSEVEFEIDHRGVRLVKASAGHGERIVSGMVGRGTVAMSTDAIMALTRGH